MGYSGPVNGLRSAWSRCKQRWLRAPATNCNAHLGPCQKPGQVHLGANVVPAGAGTQFGAVGPRARRQDSADCGYVSSFLSNTNLRSRESDARAGR
jgi:hypothetical protein